MTIQRSLFAALAAATLAACHAAKEAPVATPAPAPAPVAAAAPAGPVAHDQLHATLWMQRSAEHEALVAQTYAAARAQIDRLLADTTVEALPKGERDAGTPYAKLPPAIVVDVDETVLDNTPFQARMIEIDGEYDNVVWDQWSSQSRARALPGALEFARYAADHGVTMFYVTNRKLNEKAWTERNLRQAGFPFSASEPVLFMAGDPESCAAAGSAKSCRRKLVARGHRVIMLVGDQFTDFVDLPDNRYEVRDALEREYASWFGARWFMLPNPMYGSWEAAATAGLPKGATREQKRAAKRAALDRAASEPAR